MTKTREEIERTASYAELAGFRNGISKIHSGDDRRHIVTSGTLLKLTRILPKMKIWLALMGAPLSMHNQLEIILMDITLNGLLCIRIILDWLCRLPIPPPHSPGYRDNFLCIFLYAISVHTEYTIISTAVLTNISLLHERCVKCRVWLPCSYC